MAYNSGPFTTKFDNRTETGYERGSLVSIAKTSNKVELLNFHYNPEAIPTDKQVNWAAASMPGSDESLSQFASGSSTTLPIQFFFNDFGETPIETRNRTHNTQDALAFLQRATTRESGAGAAGSRRSPAVLKLVMGGMLFEGNKPGINVVITKLRIQRTALHPVTKRCVRAIVDVEFRKFVRFPQ